MGNLSHSQGTRLTLRVPVNITQPVDRVDGQDHLGQVELGHLLWDAVSKLAEQGQQVPPHVVVHDQVLWGDREHRTQRASRLLLVCERTERPGPPAGGPHTR